MNHNQCHIIVNHINKVFGRYLILAEPMHPLSSEHYSIKLMYKGNRYISSSSVMNIENKFYKKLDRYVLKKHGHKLSYNNTRTILWFS